MAAGLADVIVNPNQSQKAKDKLIRAKYTRHDMRRGFNVFAREAGMSLDERALILGHGRDVNENHYCGKPGIDTKRIAELLNFPIQKQA